MTYFLGLDLGQASDFTAVAIARRVLDVVTYDELDGQYDVESGADPEEVRERLGTVTDVTARYEVGYLSRFPLGTSYPRIVREVVSLWGRTTFHDGLENPPRLVVDATGVGAPLVDLFRAAEVEPLIPVIITGGDAVTAGGGAWRVPKRDLVGVLQSLMQSGRLAVAAELPHAPTLQRELAAFKVKIDPLTAHDSYGAWRDGAHDDMVLALAVALWWAESEMRRDDGTEWEIAV